MKGKRTEGKEATRNIVSILFVQMTRTGIVESLTSGTDVIMDQTKEERKFFYMASDKEFPLILDNFLTNKP